MESIERLRKMDDGMLVPLGNGQYVHDHSHNDIADEIEREISERYIPLPLDADGVSIKVGDEIETRDGEKVTAGFVSWDAVAYFNSANILTWDVAGEMRHIKLRTIEDVLRDYGVDCSHDLGANPDSTIAESTIAKYAAEIRELMGVGE